MRVVCCVWGMTVALMCQLAVPAPAAACDCASPAGICVAFGRADAVFVGRVMSTDEDYRVEFSVLEAFSGVTTARVRLGEKGRFSNCDIPFKAGETYLVYAYKSRVSNALTTNICSRTQLIASAQEDLTYVRRIVTLKPGTRGRIDGSVAVARVEREGRNYQYSSSPLPHITVVVEREGGRYYAVTNAKGEFSISGVPVGTYEARPVVPDVYAAPSRHTVRVWDPLGCGQLNFVVEYDGRISGRLVRPDGTGASGLVVALSQTTSATIERDDMWVETWSDEDGRFELRRAQPGTYLLRVDTTPGDAGGFVFYRGPLQATANPAEGTLLQVDRGKKIALPQVVLPQIPALLVMTAVIVDENGRPVERAEVRLRDNWEMGPVYRTGPSGRFTFAVVEGRRYNIHATKYERDAHDRTTVRVAIVPFKADRSGAPLQVVVKPQDY